MCFQSLSYNEQSAGFNNIEHCATDVLPLSEQSKSMKSDEKYKCNVCNKCLSTISNLRRHESIHSGTSRYKCDISVTKVADNRGKCHWLLHIVQ